MFENVRKILDLSVQMGVPAIEMMIMKDGKVEFHDVRGVKDSDGTALLGGEKYNIYSCSKPITCATALSLLEEGKISLDDELCEYIPAFGDMKVIKDGGIFKAEKRITLKNLFQMTAGLSYDVSSDEILECRRDTDGRCPTVEAMNYIAKRPLLFEPGTRYNYSLCHDVLAAVVEIVTGKRFGLYVKEKIFDPLEMKDTTFLLPEEEVPTLVAQYRHLGDGVMEEISRNIRGYKLGSEYESGGAGCISTVSDYMKFLEAMRTEKIISRETLDIMLTTTLTPEQLNSGNLVAMGYTYGLGVRVPDERKRRTDYGWGGAAGAYLAVDEKNAMTVFYAQHVLNTPNANIRKDVVEAAKLDLGFDAYVADMFRGTGSTLA